MGPGMGLPSVAAWMFAALTLVVAGDTAGKALGGMGVHPFVIAWTRFVLALVLLAPVLGPVRANLRGSLRPLLALRGATIALAISSILTALRTEPLADVYGAFFIGPVVAYVLACVLLGERTTPVRSGLMGLGFAGVLLVVQPGLDFHFGIIFAVIAGCCYGTYLVLTRRLAGQHPAGTLLFSQLLWGSVVLAVPGAAHLDSLARVPVGPVAGLVLVSALGSAAGNWLIVRISRVVPGTLVAPLVYLQLVSATAMGWIVFGSWPDAVALAGLAVITVSGLGSLWFARDQLAR